MICCWLLQGEPGAMGLPGLEGLPGAKVSSTDFRKVFPPAFQTEMKASRIRQLPIVCSEILNNGFVGRCTESAVAPVTDISYIILTGFQTRLYSLWQTRCTKIKHIWSGYSYVIELAMCAMKGCSLLFDFACRRGEFLAFFFFFSLWNGQIPCMFVQHSTSVTSSDLCFGGESEVWHMQSGGCWIRMETSY